MSIREGCDISSPQSPATRRDRDIREGKKHAHHRSVHKDKACPNPPAAPSTVTESFQITEDKTQLNFAPKVSWAVVTRDEQGHKIDIHQYVVQMVATSGGGVDANGMGPPVEFEDGKPRMREMHKNIPKHDSTGKSTDPADDYFVVYPEVPRPKTWYWQARVAAVDEKGCQGDWTPWTNQKLPWQTDAGRGAVPVPTGVTMIFDTIEKSRHDRYRAEVSFNEVQNWDIPGGDHQTDVAGYVVQLQSGTNTYPPGPSTTWDVGADGTPKYRERHKSAKDTDTDNIQTAVFEKIHKHYYYRARARTIDRFNRRSAWSNWVPDPNVGTTPSDNAAPPVPTLVDLNMNAHEARITWDEVIDPSTNILHRDVAFFRVQLSKNASFSAPIAYKDDFCITQHKVFKLDKPKGTWFARVAAVDAAGNGQNNWSAVASDTPRKPPAVPNVRLDYLVPEPANGNNNPEPKKWEKAKARVRWDPVQEQSDDISHYVVELQAGDVTRDADKTWHPQNTFTKDSHRWTGHVPAPTVIDDVGTEEADASDATSTIGGGPNQTNHPYEWMHAAKRGHWYRARVRAVDKDGQQGDWGPNPPDGWSGNGQWRQKCSPANARTLKKPQNVANIKTVKQVGVRWSHPLDIDGNRDESIDYFRVQVGTAAPDPVNGFPFGTIQEDDDYVNARRAMYAPQNFANPSAPSYYIAVQAVDEIGNTSDWAYETAADGVTPVPVTADTTALGPGDINDPSLFSPNVRPIVVSVTLPTLPDGNYPGGSHVYLALDPNVPGTTWTAPWGTVYTRQKLYRNKAGTWTAEIFAGDLADLIQTNNIAANAIVASKILAGAITGDKFAGSVFTGSTFVLSSQDGTSKGAFRTDLLTLPRIEMSQVDGPDRIAFYNPGTGGTLGKVFLQANQFTPTGGTRRDLIEMLVPGATPAEADSGFSWGKTASSGVAHSRLLNSGGIQLGGNQLNVGDPDDTSTCRLFWDNQTNQLKLRWFGGGVPKTQVVQTV